MKYFEIFENFRPGGGEGAAPWTPHAECPLNYTIIAHNFNFTTYKNWFFLMKIRKGKARETNGPTNFTIGESVIPGEFLFDEGIFFLIIDFYTKYSSRILDRDESVCSFGFIINASQTKM